MHKDSIITVLVSVIASVVISVALAATVSGKSSVPAAGSQDMNQAIEDYLMNNPTKVQDALNLAQQQAQAEEQKRITESYKTNFKDLSDTANAPFTGPKDAKITIVEFFDFNCGYCKHLAPEMMKIIKANPDVKVVFRPVTFLGSMPIAKAAIAAQKQGKFMELYEAFLTAEGRVDEATIEEKIKAAGLDVAKTKQLMESAEVKKVLDESAELFQRINGRGVPTLIINGEPLPAIEQGPIQAAIDNLK